MSATHGIRYSDRIARIIESYGLSLSPELMTRVPAELRASRPDRHDRFAEEEAAIFLARMLHTLVMANARAGAGDAAIEELRAVWTRFLHQAEYRVELGLINKVLFDYEIRPLVDELPRTAPPNPPAPGDATGALATCALRVSS